MALAPGARLGPYEVLHVLGTGGMGEVYAARDTQLRRTAAIKVLPEAVSADPVRLARFEREAQLASSLNHPNIVTIYGIGREGQVAYIAMELVDGQTLQAALKSGAWPMARLVDVASQIAGGLAKAHEAGIVHRDLKPQNVMITHDGLVKLLDFGLSTLTPGADPSEATTATNLALTQPGVVLGTVHYMSPEQAAGRAVDFRSDQFSFGSMLYELLAGRRPFEAPTAVQVLSAIIAASPAPISEVNPDVPDGVATVVERCLAKAPDNRYASTRDLARDLQIARDRSATGALSRRSTPRPAVVTRRRRRIWIGAALTVAALATLASPAVRSRLRWPWTPPAPAHQQIAVLPFTAVGNDPATQTFADGLVEVLTTQLSQIARFNSAIDVVPASDVRVDKVTSVREARQAFHVSRVVTGSVQNVTGIARVTVTLSDAETQRQLDGRSIDLKDKDVGSMQDAVVREVAAMIGTALPPEAQRAWEAGGTTSATAFEAYLQGRGHLQHFDRIDEVDAAIAAFHRAIGQDRNYALAHAGLAEAYWRKYDLTKDPQWIAPARESGTTAASLADRLAPVHVVLGIIDRGSGQYEDAVAEERRAIALDPLDANAYRELANAYQALGRAADTEATYKTAIEVRPAYWANYNALGAFYLNQNRNAEAETTLKRALEVTPDSTRVLNNIGALYFRTGRYDDAMAAFRKSIAVKPNGVAYSQLGTVLYFRERYADAARQMEKAVEMGRGDSRLLKNLASAYAMAPGEGAKAPDAFKGALAAAEREIEVNPRDAALLMRAAECHAELRQASQARARADQALGLAPGNAALEASAGAVYERLGDRARAIQLIRVALDHGYSRDLIDRSPDLAALRADPRFKKP